MKPTKFLMYISQNYSYAILRPLQKAILAQGGEVKWFLEGNAVNNQYLLKSEKQLKSIQDVIDWQPQIVYVPGNVVPNFISGIKVEVFHGFETGKFNHRGKQDHFNIRGCFDLYCTQGPNTTLPFKKLAEKYKYFDVVETGWPTLDPMFTTINNNPYIDSSDPRKTVLMCSTFSKHLTCAPHLYHKIKELSQKGSWRFLIQFHPKMDKAIIDMYKKIQSPNLTFIETDNIIPLLQAADVMLCDTSSVLQMFLLLRKPVVTFKNNTGGNYLINITETTELEKAITTALTYPPMLMNNIEHYCQQLHPYQDSKSSERVIAASIERFNKQSLIKHKKPLNLIRMIKLRKKLKYWKLFNK